MSTDNPLGLDGMEFVEYASPNPQALKDLFVRLGFTLVGKHKKKKVSLYRQNQISFILNEEPNTFAHQFAKAHGPSICATGFRVKNADFALKEAVKRGAKAVDTVHDQASHSFPAMYGIGDSAIYFIDRYQNQTHFDEDFEYVSVEKYPKGKGLLTIDHLTNNVPAGEMQKWCDFYSKIFGFSEVRKFNIKGAQTGLVSKVMRSADGKITIPINEPTEKKSQIQEYLDEYHGSGIQHLAMLTRNICESVEKLATDKINFLESPPQTYYDMLNERVPNVTEDVKKLQQDKILVDGDDHGYLLQIFTKNLIGPIFYEIIQRKGHEGFGEGNFQALFDAIERDQKARGYL